MKISQQPVALITGAARRVGRVIAKHFHQAGYNVVIHCRNSLNEAQNLCAELENVRENSAAIVQADLADISSITKLSHRAVQAFGRLDVLINNASSFYATPISETTEAQWDDLFSSNAKGAFFLSQAAAPHLRAAKGSIINLVDIYAQQPLANHAVYCMAKSALLTMTLALAKDLAPAVRVNAIAPGAVLWPEQGKSYDDQQMLIARTPLKRSGTPEDIAVAALFLARDASFVTGQVLRVDGGRSLSN